MNISFNSHVKQVDENETEFSFKKNNTDQKNHKQEIENEFFNESSNSSTASSSKEKPDLTKDPFKTYQLRKRLVNHKKEPEIIELTDSSDEESQLSKKIKENNSSNPFSNDSNDKFPISAIKKRDDSNLSNLEAKNFYAQSKSNSNETNTNFTNTISNKIIFEDWAIKESDLESIEDILNGEENCEKMITENNSLESICEDDCEFKLNCCFFKMDFYTSENSFVAYFTRESINFKLNEDDYEIAITIGTEDIIYCAAIFHDPNYFLLIKVPENILKIYLTELESLNQKFKINEKLEKYKSSIFLQLSANKQEATKISRDLYYFFRTALPPSIELKRRLDFLSYEKSAEIVYSFMGTKSKNNEIKLFLKKYIAKKNAPRILIKHPSEVSNVDLHCLKDTEFLNDNIIRFYLKYLEGYVLTEKNRQRTHIFDTFFYQRLTQSSTRRPKEEMKMNAAERRHLRVKNWTKDVNLFEKDFLIVPINKRAHWFLVIICYAYLNEPVYEETNSDIKSDSNELSSKEITDASNTTFQNEIKEPLKASSSSNKTKAELSALDIDSADEAEGDSNTLSTIIIPENKICIKMPVILIFDSLLASQKSRVTATLKEYLEYEWKAKYPNQEKKFNNLINPVVKVPTQKNSYDCGIYLLQYVESFFKNPIKNFKQPLLLENWFNEEEITKKRSRIKEIIFEFEKIKSEIKQEAKISSDYIIKDNDQTEQNLNNENSNDSLEITEKPDRINDYLEETNNDINDLSLNKKENKKPRQNQEKMDIDTESSNEQIVNKKENFQEKNLNSNSAHMSFFNPNNSNFQNEKKSQKIINDIEKLS